LKLFLTAVAVVDDVGAVAIIAFGYTNALNWIACAAAAMILVLMLGISRAGERRLWLFVALSLALWMATFLSGVHATVAGVLAALSIPLTRSPAAPDDMHSPLHRLEHALHPWVAFAILPIFAFANAGVTLTDFGAEVLLSPLPLAIAASLFVGKQVGIFGSVRLAVALGWAQKPHGANWLQVYGVGMLCGIGFTMSLFIGGLAFPDEATMSGVKVGVLAGSILSAAIGFILLRFAAPSLDPTTKAMSD
jgi:NhaA family Na+:H+ antiporter